MEVKIHGGVQNERNVDFRIIVRLRSALPNPPRGSVEMLVYQHIS